MSDEMTNAAEPVGDGVGGDSGADEGARRSPQDDKREEERDGGRSPEDDKRAGERDGGRSPEDDKREGERGGGWVLKDLGRMGYAEAMAIMRATHDVVGTGAVGPTLLLVEHDPVITVSRRKGASGNVFAHRRELKEMGITLEKTDRGGDVTYHGPGQLVAYPIVRLEDLKMNIGTYMRKLEEAVSEALGAFGIIAEPIEGQIGLWVRGHEGQTFESEKKIAAFGVRVKRKVTMHGLAVNVTTDLSHFKTIRPCGLSNMNVTSVGELIGAGAGLFERVKAELIATFDRVMVREPTKQAEPER